MRKMMIMVKGGRLEHRQQCNEIHEFKNAGTDISPSRRQPIKSPEYVRQLDPTKSRVDDV